MTNYLVTRLINDNSIFYPTPFIIGNVEIKSKKYDLFYEQENLNKSLELNDEKINIDIAMRISTIIELDESKKINFNEVEKKTDFIFEEILDLLNYKSFGISQVILLKSGIIKNLTTGEISPIKKDVFKPSPIFRVASEEFPVISFEEYIYYCQDKQLCQRYLKSLHWSRISLWEKNLQLKILFNWFSLESLLKQSRNDNIIPKIMLCMGFPLRKKLLDFNRNFLINLQNYNGYKHIKNEIKKYLIEIRKFRNDTVHEGYRRWDISYDKLILFSFIINSAKSSVSNLISLSITNNFTTINDFWNNATNLCENSKNFINYVHNTFLFLYKNKTYALVHEL